MSQSYQVLARKYRPNNFHELVGQTHVSNALINAIDYNRLHHAYLFTGTRGVGKTTIARILAKCLNCDTGISSTPCGQCNSCQMIEQGRFIDLIEIDAASRTKVEDTRELLDNVPYAPTQGRYKVYLIDEVHMLSTHSFNALLKTLEEPPEHVKFLLATTDPQKLPITIISRCLQFVLRPLSQELISEHLSQILTKEHVQFEQEALWQLAHSAKGSVRDSLSLTDQAIAFSQGALTAKSVNEMLGLINGADLIGLLTSIYNNDTLQVARQIEQMRQQMVNASSVFDELAELLHKIALWQILPTLELNVNPQQSSAIKQLSQQVSADSLQLYYEIVIKSRENLALATTPMQALEMCLLRMLAFYPLANNAVVITNKTIEKQEETIEQSVDNFVELAQENPVTTQNSLTGQDGLTENHPQEIVESKLTEIHNEPHTEQQIKQQTETEEKNKFVEDIQIETKQSTQESESKLISSTELFFTDYDYNENHVEDLEESIEENYEESMESLAEDMVGQTVAKQGMIEQNAVKQNVRIENLQVPEDKLIKQDVMAENPDIIETNEVTANLEPVKVIESPVEEAVIEPITEAPTQTNKQVEDPRQLLKCSPQELTGDWTTEKWDYWVQVAREQQLLDKDELAFARQGIMTGNCDGESIFLTQLNSNNFSAVFTNISQKLKEQFTNASYQIDSFVESSHHQQTPENKQQQRQQLAEGCAIEQLSQSPAMLKLQEYGVVRISNVRLYQ